GSFEDPRQETKAGKFGALPKEWAHYQGLYVNGNKVILSYTVGKSHVLEMPTFEWRGGLPVFTRNFHIDKSPEPMLLQVCETQNPKGQSIGGVPVLINQTPTNASFTAATAIATPQETAWEIRDVGGIRLKLPAFDQPIDFKVLVTQGDATVFTNLVTAFK